MPTSCATRPPVGVGVIAAAMLLVAPAHPVYAASDVFESFREAGQITSGKDIVRLLIPRGRYAIFAKINIDQDDEDASLSVEMVCTLRATGDRDRNVVRLQQSRVDAVDNIVTNFQVVEELRGSVNILGLACTFPASESKLVSFRHARIMAIRVDLSLCEEESPGTCP